ncbi:MAG: DUF1674 domain-containing protein [Steroidobacteraceae bacterium]
MQSKDDTSALPGAIGPPLPETPPGAPERRSETVLPREIGGRDGPEPTRFGDWEKAGRCIDF